MESQQCSQIRLLKKTLAIVTKEKATQWALIKETYLVADLWTACWLVKWVFQGCPSCCMADIDTWQLWQARIDFQVRSRICCMAEYWMCSLVSWLQQAFLRWQHILQTMESWMGPGNEANAFRFHVNLAGSTGFVVVKNGHWINRNGWNPNAMLPFC